jgi:EF-hand domain
MGSISQDVVLGLDVVLSGDLMSNIEWFFALHDKNNDGYLTKDEVLQLSESLLVCLFLQRCIGVMLIPPRLKFIFRDEPGDHVCVDSPLRHILALLIIACRSIWPLFRR